MSVLVVFTGPEDERLVRVRLPGLHFEATFQRWKTPKMVPDEVWEHLQSQPGFIEKGFSLKQWLETNEDKSLVIRRHSALGDLIQLIMALHDKPELLFRVEIETQYRYQKFADYFWPTKIDKSKVSTGLVLNFDGLVELDQTEDYYRKLHRIDIFREFLGIYQEEPQLPKFLEQDLSDYWKNARLRIPATDYYVINQKGSRYDNTLPPDLLQKLVDKLRETTRVVLVTTAPTHPDDLPDDLEYPALFRVVANAKRLIVTDSGLLWVAHLTKTPTTLLLGNTTFETRLKYLPADKNFLDVKTLVDKYEHSYEKYLYDGDFLPFYDAVLEKLNE